MTKEPVAKAVPAPLDDTEELTRSHGPRTEIVAHITPLPDAIAIVLSHLSSANDIFTSLQSPSGHSPSTSPAGTSGCLNRNQIGKWSLTLCSKRAKKSARDCLFGKSLMP